MARARAFIVFVLAITAGVALHSARITTCNDSQPQRLQFKPSRWSWLRPICDAVPELKPGDLKVVDWPQGSAPVGSDQARRARGAWGDSADRPERSGSAGQARLERSGRRPAADYSDRPSSGARCG